MNRTHEFDAIVIGGGHNGLVAAGYLADGGLSVGVLEARDHVGGPASWNEFIPGYYGSMPHSPSTLETFIIRDLDLAGFGLEFIKADPTLVHPLENGRVFVAHRDQERTAGELEALDPGESARYNSFFDYLRIFAERLGVSLFQEPPSLQHLVRNLTRAEDAEAFSRVFFGSTSELMEWFGLGPDVQAIIGTLATVSGPPTPDSPGSVLNLLLRPLSLASPGRRESDDPRRFTLRGSTGLPVGGMAAVSEAMASSLRARGGVVMVGTKVVRVEVDGGTVGVLVTEDDEVFSAPIVISAIDPLFLLRDLLPSTPEWAPFQKAIQAKRYAGDACKVVLALDEAPEWAATRTGVSPRALASAQFRIAPSVEYLNRAYGQTLLHQIPDEPVIWGVVTSLTSTNLAPRGRHLMSLNASASPDVEGQDWDEAAKATMIRRCVSAISRWMPGLESHVVDARCMPPHEIEEEFYLPGSEICHGDVLAGNQFWMRPLPGLHRYRTPTKGLYLSGAGTWPGNFTSGVPGYNASQAVLSDLKNGIIEVSRA